MRKDRTDTKIPVTLITGYLGSGKTTLMNELIRNQDNEGLALIINDMGSVNIDANLMKSSKVMESDTTMIELQNGCICCTLRDAFMEQIEQLAMDDKVTRILVEASGISNPAAVAEGFIAYEEMEKETSAFLNRIVTVVDADRIYTEFLAQMEDNLAEENEDDPDIINLVMDQIEFCNTVILNKCDLLPAAQIARVKEVICQLQPEAEIIESIHGNVDPERIFSGKPFDYDSVMNSSILQKALSREKTMEEQGMDEYGITSFVFDEKQPLDRERFMSFVENEYPEELIRAKGYIWFADDDKHVQLFEQAGRNATVSETSNWVESLPEQEKQEVFENYPEVLEDWDDIYGDRFNQIVFIGRNYDQDRILRMLNQCIAKK